MVARGEFYAGSKILQPLVSYVGLPLDQLNFLVCQIVGLLLAIPFRTVLSPASTSVTVRLTVELVAGLALSLFCFGQVWYLAGQAVVSYLLMKYGSPRWSQKAVFVFCMVYLSVAHILRQYYDYGGYTLDITGPMMIQTQKLTSLAFALSDGHRSDPSRMTADQKSQAIKEVPDLLSFFSFMFYFHGVMCGPLAFYSDYMAFIDGSYLTSFPSSKANGSAEESTKEHVNPMSNLNSCLAKKLVTAAVTGLIMVSLPSMICPPEGLRSEQTVAAPSSYREQHKWSYSGEEFFQKTFLQRSLYVLVCMTLAKQKYYFAWTLGESVNIAAGLGFNGYDNSGKPKWDLVENVDIWDVEMALSLKVNIDGWNKKTLVWLRRVVYDRAPKYQTLAVFAVSAFWHGFYPGYYLTFGTAALFTIAARQVRRNVRPYFQKSRNMRLLYDAITFMFTRMANAYITFPFMTLELMPTLHVYAAQYFWMHLAALAVVVYFTVLPPPKRPSQESIKQD
ncbi:hypothetical protein BaRGS_00028672 [Batillaria attramentaria]|uniref:Uncharacterized protein n=1 Tax=Batillaria attramentaria TaxID=370345 RepID=A0ABD0JYG4_9CAEN